MALNRFHYLNSADYSAQAAQDYQNNLDMGQPSPGFASAGSFSAMGPTGISLGAAPGGTSQGDFTVGAAGSSTAMVVTSAKSGLVFVNTLARACIRVTGVDPNFDTADPNTTVRSFLFSRN